MLIRSFSDPISTKHRANLCCSFPMSPFVWLWMSAAIRQDMPGCYDGIVQPKSCAGDRDRETNTTKKTQRNTEGAQQYVFQSCNAGWSLDSIMASKNYRLSRFIVNETMLQNALHNKFQDKSGWCLHMFFFWYIPTNGSVVPDPPPVVNQDFMAHQGPTSSEPSWSVTKMLAAFRRAVPCPPPSRSEHQNDKSQYIVEPNMWFF